MAREPTDEEQAEQAEFLRQIGLRVKAMREQIGMTRGDMTYKANIKPAYGYLIEAEGQNFTLRTLLNIAKVLDCLPRDLLPQPPADSDLESQNHSLREKLLLQHGIIEHMDTAAAAVREYMETNRQPLGYPPPRSRKKKDLA